MAANENQDVGAKMDSELSRRQFLQVFASTALAGLVAPAVLGKTQEVKASTVQADNRQFNIQEIAEPIEGEDPIVRMSADLARALEKPMAERRWIMVIDLRKCTGCNGCSIACVTENKLPPGMTYRPVFTETRGTFPNVSRRFIPRPCMQCDDPPCTQVCPASATWKRADGIVIIDYDKCIGCRYCITACPYSARSFDNGFFYSDFVGGETQPYETLPSPEYGEGRIRKALSSPVGNARKCNFCIHRIEVGELPACILSCMGRAGFFGDSNDPESLVSELLQQANVMRLNEDLGVEPKVYYLV